MKAAAGGGGGGGKKGQAPKVLALRAAFWPRRPLFSARALLLKQRQFYKTNDKIASCLLVPFTLSISHGFALTLSFLAPCISSLPFLLS
jgi:hypothetical protein